MSYNVKEMRNKLKINRAFGAVLCAVMVLSCAVGCANFSHDAAEVNTQNAWTEKLSEIAETELTEETEFSAENTSRATEIITQKATAKPTTAKPNTTVATTVATTAQSSETAYAAESLTKPETTHKNKGSKFFDDVVFIGDSVSVGLENYVKSERNKGHDCLGKAQFLCSTSLGYMNAQLSLDSKNSVHPKFKGKKVLIDDGVKMSGAKKAFIMLGMNDFCGYSREKLLKNVVKLVEQIKDKAPGTEIYIESVTPIVNGKEHGKFSNAQINKFNSQLRELCNENGWEYVDVASCLMDSSGCLKKEYCGDAKNMGIHMTFPACKRWVSYLESRY